MIWANFLHAYQPPTQKPEILAKVAIESYRKLINEIGRTKRAKLTLNINGVLTDLLVQYRFDDVVRNIRRLAELGQIELTGSAKYHPLLPKLPKEEAVRQIKLNDETNRKYFGKAWNPKGFFPPEMGFSKEVAKVVSELGFKWIIADEFSYPRELGRIDYSKIYKVKGLPINIYFRERSISFKILSAQLGTGNLLLHALGTRLQEDKYLLTAMDAETFGHHRLGLEQLLFDIYRSPEIKSQTISELPKHFKEVVEVEPEPSTWALTSLDVERKSPFSRWFDPENPIHRMQWQLTELALRTVNKNRDGRGWQKAREALDRSLHSDQYWWAGAKPWWSIEYIERGAKELMEAIALTPGVKNGAVAKSKELYFRILSQAFDWQRDGIVDQMAKSEDEEVRQRTDANLPYLAIKEFERMIVNLKHQMLTAAKNEEYERAGQFRDRIAELREKQQEIGKNKQVS